MVRVTFDVSELNTLAADFGKAAGAVGDKVAQVLRKTAMDIEADAKMFAPVDTGNLRASIGHTDLAVTAGALETVIGPTAEYGAFVEFGTSRMAPHAYMGPALDRRTPGFVSALEQVAGDIL